MHFFLRSIVNDTLKLCERQSFRLVHATNSGRIRSDYLLNLLNNSRVGIPKPLTCLPSDLVKPEEAIAFYGLTKQELRRWSRRKYYPAPHYKFNKMTIRYPLGLLGEWLKEHSK